eukprot:UN00484
MLRQRVKSPSVPKHKKAQVKKTKKVKKATAFTSQVSSISTATSVPATKRGRAIKSIKRKFNSAAVPEGHLTVSVNDQEIVVPKGFTVFQAAEAAGATIPRFCYHERLSIAGNCRMCLVEVEKVPKPVASCAYPLMAGMKIKTDTPMVKKAREGVLEFILANHPLDCPICDQGGECDLQDQSYEYGSDRTRFREIKRSVEDKYIGPVIRTVMTRCINCTRCVRFAEEVAGVPDLGVTGRGNNAEIGTYTNKVFDSELSGNAIDLCPVGALTNQQYAFKARPWELESTHSIDVSDAIGSNMRLDSRGTTVLRALPRLNDGVNEEWISDKARLSVDGLALQRLDVPLKKLPNGQFKQQTWSEALIDVKNTIKSVKVNNPNNEIKAVVGDVTDAETIIALKDMVNAMGSSNTEHVDGLKFSADLRTHYLFNTGIANLDEADCVVLVGTNPRMEAPILNARIRRQVFNRRVPVYGVGPEADLALDMKWVGNSTDVAQQLVDEKSELFQKVKNAKKPVIVFGSAMFKDQEQAEATINLMEQMQGKLPNVWDTSDENGWKGLNVLQASASRVAALDLGFVTGPDVEDNAVPKILIAAGADSDALSAQIQKMREVHGDEAKVIYMGSHGDKTAPLADVILPSTAFSEKHVTYVNAEGRVQKTNKAVANKHLAQDDWKVVRALSEVLDVTLPYNNLEEVHNRISLVAPTFTVPNHIEKAETFLKYDTKKNFAKGQQLQKLLDNHFMTNSICRASPTMAKLAKEMPNSTNSYKL